MPKYSQKKSVILTLNGDPTQIGKLETHFFQCVIFLIKYLTFKQKNLDLKSDFIFLTITLLILQAPFALFQMQLKISIF